MKKFFHEIPQNEVDNLIESGKTWRYIIDTYNRPSWCSRKDALAGKVGCKALTSLRDKRSKISEEYCGKCPSFKLV